MSTVSGSGSSDTPNPREQRAGYVGWVEFTRDGGSTTHIAYLYEYGSPYFPEGGLTEWDLRASEASGRMWPLVRTAWEQP